MISIVTYLLEPYLKGGVDMPFSTEWLRTAVSRLIRRERGRLEESGVEISLFYNHGGENEQFRIGYPLIIYHYIDDVFYITGINQGTDALKTLAGFFTKPFEVSGVLFPGFRKVSSETVEIKVTDDVHRYSLVQWIPVHHKDVKAFRKMPLVEKAELMNRKLHAHLCQELGKFLNLDISNTTVNIIEITGVYRPVKYKNYEYPAFDIIFESNVNLPSGLTLGNNKALGFGRIKLLS